MSLQLKKLNNLSLNFSLIPFVLLYKWDFLFLLFIILIIYAII